MVKYTSIELIHVHLPPQENNRDTLGGSFHVSGSDHQKICGSEDADKYQLHPSWLRGKLSNQLTVVLTCFAPPEYAEL